MPTIRGKITDQYGQPAARTVRLYRRDTGAFLGETSSAAAAEGGDPDFDKVSLLLHMDGADGSTTFTDSSPRPKTVTAIGNAKISTAQGLFGGASGYFDGSGDALAIAHAADLNLASGDWTIEFWFYLVGNLAGAYILDKDGVENSSFPSYGITVGSGGVALHLGTGNGLSGLQSFSGTTAVSANAWHHAAFGRAGSTIYGFLDGVQQFASTQTVAMVDGGKKINIGARYDGASFPMCGYVKDLRITKGEARYAANFIPPTMPFPASMYTPQNILGDYYLSTSYVGEVQRIVLDSQALGDPTKLNDLVDRVFLI